MDFTYQHTALKHQLLQKSYIVFQREFLGGLPRVELPPPPFPSTMKIITTFKVTFATKISTTLLKNETPPPPSPNFFKNVDFIPL